MKMKVQAGARYMLFGERLIAVTWDVDNGAGEWIILEAARTGEPRYRVLDSGGLERCELQADGGFLGVPCDLTVDDLVLAVRPL